MNPLDGIVVVSLEHAVAGPFATRQLADLGARVIKIERPGVGDFARGYDRAIDGESSYFVWLNRGKESIELDLKAPADLALLHRMIASADVFLQNLAPRAAGRLGLDGDTLLAQHPQLIHCSISGYGTDGPYSSKKAYDLLIQVEGGVVDVTGTLEEPAKVGFSVVDIAAGMYAYSGILAALYERSRTGRGSVLDVSMLDAIGEWMTQPMTYSVYGDTTQPRAGARHATIAPYGPYPVGDGVTIFLGVQSDREWRVLCEKVLGRPDLIDDPRFVHNTERVEHEDQVRPIITAAFASWTADALVCALEEHGIACARLRTAAESWRHPQHVARDRFRLIEAPGGPTEALLPPVIVRGREAAMGDVPALGQDNDRLRAEFALRVAEPAR